VVLGFGAGERAEFTGGGPGTLSGRGGRVLLERAEELGALRGAIDRAAAGAGGVVYVEGPAGIGKSSLLDACARMAGCGEMLVLRAQGDVLVMESSFAAVRDLLWPEVRGAGVDRLEGAARLAVPVFEVDGAGGGDRDRTSSVLHGLYWLVADLAERRPVVLLVDDAQWLDGASARFVEYLARRAESLRVLIVVALRIGELPEGAQFDTVMMSLATSVLRPRALSGAASAEVVRSVLGLRADGELCGSCHDATGGNPFYLYQLAVALEDERQRPTVELAARVRALGVRTVGASVLVRLGRLGPECVRLARALAILGPGSPLRRVSSLAALDQVSARVAVDQLHDAQILSATGGLSFVHSIVSEAIAAQIPPAHAAAFHGDAARLLAADGAPIDRVAAHLLSAEAAGEVGTVEVLRAAARVALARGAPEAAVTYLRRALAEPPPETWRLEVLLELGRAESLLPVIQDFAALREALELAVEPDHRAAIARELALALCGVFRNVDARVLIEEMLEEIEDQLDPGTVESLDFILIAIGMDDLDAAPRVHHRAALHLERAERGEVTDPRMLAALAVEVSLTGASAERATRLALQALDDPRLIGDWLEAGYVTAAVALATAGALDEAAAATERGIVEAQRRGSAPMLLQLAMFRAEAALFAGDLDAAEDFVERAVDFARVLGPDANAAIHIPVIHLERGRLAQAIAAAESADPVISTAWGSMIQAERGRVRIAAGDLLRGLEDVLAASGRMRAAGLALSCFSDWAPAAVDALAQLGREREAIDLAQAELLEARAFGAARRLGIALSLSGSMDPGPAGLQALRDAVELLGRSPAPLEHARALLRLGVGLGARSNTPAARAALTASLDLAHRCGGWALVNQARAALIASGARPRRARSTGRGALTPAQLRAARLAAAGMSNREIAQALFVSTKTIEGQLSEAYAKLGVRSRGELPAPLALGGDSTIASG
jgi:DNA-binding CsgD family transcriptional regulator